MAHTYTFTAASLNTNLFFKRHTRFSVNATDPLAEGSYQKSPSRQYVARTSSGDTHYYWTCGVYFGKNDNDVKLLNHIRSLPNGSITSITLSFSEYAGNSADASWYWDTAANDTGTNFESSHKKDGIKTISRDTSGRGSVVLNVTEYGVPASYGWLFRCSLGSYLYLTSAVTLTVVTNETYSLSISAGTGSQIIVNRTLSSMGATGNLSNGAELFYGDVLKISFAPSANYSITTHTVNGTSFTSGNSYEVSGNVSVSATATPLKSGIGATDANIGSTSTITVTRYNTGYTHTITYSFGGVTGTIVTKSSVTSIAWTVPTTFYAVIPNAKTGTCTLTCETFNGNTSLGSNSTTITVTAAKADCAPTVSGTVVDTNDDTIALTGNSSTLIRYKSNARCTITITTKNSAKVSTGYIDNYGVAPGLSVTTFSSYTTYAGVSKNSFDFIGIDSRGYSSSVKVTNTLISYVNLTCNPTIYRVTPTGSEVRMDVSGDYYRGSFGSYSNTLTMRYRYKLSSSSTWGAWTTVSSFTYGTNSYSKTGAVLGTSFDYQSAYDFQVQVYDGANGITLSTVTKTIELKRGIPIFDWGENDFNFRVPIKLGDTQITEAQLIQLLALIT